MEALELSVGPYRYSAIADGPRDGELVLLVHGFPETSFEWRHQVATLGAAGYRAVAPDQRGYARDARPGDLDQYRIEHLVADVVGFADALGADRFHLVGHDWGGFVAWYTAATHPERLLTLTVVSTPHPVPFRGAMRHGTDQRERSSYMQWFRTPDAEATFLADDAALLARRIRGPPGGRRHRVPAGVHRRRRRRAHRRVGVVPRQRLPGPGRSHHHTDALRLVDR